MFVCLRGRSSINEIEQISGVFHAPKKFPHWQRTLPSVVTGNAAVVLLRGSKGHSLCIFLTRPVDARLFRHVPQTVK
jgi:hypothetical protein